MSVKITLKEFFDSYQFLAINCTTQEQADILMKAFDKIGKQWSTGSSYLTTNVWPGYRENTCYDNRGGYADKSFFETNNHQVLKFDDIDLTSSSDEYIKTNFLIFKKDDFICAYYQRDNIIVMLKNGIDISQPVENDKSKIDLAIKEIYDKLNV